MKKLLTKILFIAVTFSVVGQNFVQAETAKKENSTWQLIKTSAQGIGSGAKGVWSMGTEVASRAGGRLSWLANSVFTRGSELFSACITRLAPHSNILKKINSKHAAAGVVAALSVVGGIAYYRRYNPKYEELYKAIQPYCGTAYDEEDAQQIFEEGPGGNYLPKWYHLQTKASYMRGFEEFCEDRRDRNLWRVANNYYRYLTRPWLTKRDIQNFFLGGAAILALTFKSEKESTVCGSSVNNQWPTG